MTKSVAHNAAANVAHMFVSALLLFVLYRYIIDTLGAAGLGVWSVVLATASASRLAELGLGASVTRFVARYAARNEPKKAEQIIETAVISLMLLVGFALPLLYWVFWWCLSYFLQAEHLAEARALLPYALTSLWLSILAAVMQSGLDGCQRMDLRAGLSIVGQILMVGLAFPLIPKYGLIGLAWAQIAQGAFLLVAGWWLLRGRLSGLPVIPMHWSRSLFKEMLGYGANVQAATLTIWLLDPLTKVLMAKFGGPAAAGYFEMASQAVTKVRSLILAANQAVVPKVAEIVESNPEKLPTLYRENLRTLTFVALPVFSLLYGWSGLVAWVLTGEINQELLFLLQLNTVAWLANTFAAPAYFSNLGSGRVGWNTLAHVVMGLLNGTLGWVFGQWFGAVGVAFSYAASLVAGGLVLIIAFHKRLDIRPGNFSLREHAGLIALCAVLVAVTSFTWVVEPNSRFFGVAFLFVLSAMLVFVTWRHPVFKKLWARFVFT